MANSVEPARERYNLGRDLTDRHVIHGRGDGVALVFEDSAGVRAEFRYRDLAALSNRFANVLRKLGVAPGDRVLFRVPNHPAFFIGALGCAKAGAVFVPTSTLFKDHEVEYRLRDSGATVCVTTASLRREVDRAAATCPALRAVVIVDDHGEPSCSTDESWSRALAAAREHFVPADTRGDDPAFIAYTSGTTGDPKGILHLHRYAASYDYLIDDWHGFRAGDVTACPSEIGWMLPVASTFLYAMRAGITSVCYREHEPRFRPDKWCELLARRRVTRFVGTPTIWRMLLTVDHAARRFDLARLVSGTSAGEPLPGDTLERVRSAFGFAPQDGLGMSECMVYAHARIGEEPTPGSCGRAGRGLVLAVLDDELRPVRDGEEGVLHLRRDSHPGLMREYWNKPDATAEAFIGEWYRTGDVVTRDESGRFFFKGRADDVMKCSGFRISPFEVESALQSHPAVLEAAAVEFPDELRGNVVKAFVTLRDGHAPSDDLAAGITEHVRRQLAPFKAPKHVEFVATLPKTQSGKILRRELRGRAAR